MCKFIVQIVFPLQIVFFGNKIVYKVLSSCGLSRTCNDIYSINKHISRILYDLFLFHRIHTYASVLRFPILHHYLCEIYHPILVLYRLPIDRHPLHLTQQTFFTTMYWYLSSPSTEFSRSRKHFILKPVR